MYVAFYDDEDNEEVFGPFDTVQVVYNQEVRGIYRGPEVYNDEYSVTTHPEYRAEVIARSYEPLSGLWIDENVGGIWKGFEIREARNAGI